MKSSEERHLTRSMVGYVIGVIAVLALSWVSGDGRVVTGAVASAGVAGVALGVWLIRDRAHEVPRVLGLAVCLVALLTTVVVSLYMRGNWDYFEGRVRMDEGDYSAAVDSYRHALEAVDAPSVAVIGPPFRLRLTAAGIVQDTRVQIYSDLGRIASRGSDWETASTAYSFALRVAESEGYDTSVTQDIKDALRGIEDAQ